MLSGAPGTPRGRENSRPLLARTWRCLSPRVLGRSERSPAFRQAQDRSLLTVDSEQRLRVEAHSAVADADTALGTAARAVADRSEASSALRATGRGLVRGRAGAPTAVFGCLGMVSPIRSLLGVGSAVARLGADQQPQLWKRTSQWVLSRA